MKKKMKTKTKNITILLLIGLVCSIFFNYDLNFSTEQKKILNDPKQSDGYIESFIHIDGSIPNNWSWTAGNYSWCYGDGSWSNPYIIENVTIDGSGMEFGILISNSKNDYFIIKNCTIYNVGFNWGDGAIVLINVSIGTIINNNCSFNVGCGITLDANCNNNTISENLVNNNLEYGIATYGSENNTISGNIVNYNQFGIYLDYDSHSNKISRNTFNYNDYGISEQGGLYNIFSSNIANFNNGDGIYIYRSNITTISNNIVNGNDIGIELDISGGTDLGNHNITKNIIYNNTQGLYIDTNYENNLIYHNFFLENGKHALDDGSDNKWNSTTIGNYWDNWTSPDTNPIDGIVDTQYNISGTADSIDHLPIAEDGTPRITINSPSEGDGFTTVAPNFDVTITEDYLDTMWYTLDGGSHNYTFTENGIINQSAWDGMADGDITLSFYAKDIPGYIGSIGVDIIKDTLAPVIIINSPTEGERFGKNAPLFNITVTEDNLDIMWYSFDGGTHIYVITNNTVFNQTAWTALAQGDVNITFYARDIAGNEATEEVSIIKSVPSGLDPAVIITIVIVSVVGGVAVAAGVYFFMKKRKTSA